MKEEFIIQKLGRKGWQKTWWTNALLFPDNDIFNFTRALKASLPDARRAMAFAKRLHPAEEFRIFPIPSEDAQ